MSKLIINADDFGYNESCSEAIAKAFSEGLISSTTAMANGEYIEKAYELAERGGFLDKVGIHIVLTEGVPLTDGIKGDAFFCDGGEFHSHINRYKKLGEEQLKHLREEVSAQIKRLKAIGFPISHADSHHHIHTGVFLVDAIEEVLKENGIEKIRIHRNIGKIQFYKKIVKNAFNKKLLKDGFITTDKMGSFEDFKSYADKRENTVLEIMVHPDFSVDGRLIDRNCADGGNNFGEDLFRIKEYIDGKEVVSFKNI